MGDRKLNNKADGHHINRTLTYCCLVTKLCLTLCEPVDCSMPGFPVLHHLPEFAQTHVQRGRNAIQPSHPLLPILLLPSIFQNIRVFSNEPTLCIMCPKYWSFSFSISPSREYSRLMVLQPTPVFLPGKSYGQRSLEGYSPKSWTPLSNFTFHFEDTFTGRTEENTQKQ